AGFPVEATPPRFARLEEQVDIVVRSWTEDELHFAGRFYRLNGARPAPRPVQQPHPPLLLGGSVRPTFARLAAARGAGGRRGEHDARDGRRLPRAPASSRRGLRRARARPRHATAVPY